MSKRNRERRERNKGNGMAFAVRTDGVPDNVIADVLKAHGRRLIDGLAFQRARGCPEFMKLHMPALGIAIFAFGRSMPVLADDLPIGNTGIFASSPGGEFWDSLNRMYDQLMTSPGSIIGSL